MGPYRALYRTLYYRALFSLCGLPYFRDPVGVGDRDPDPNGNHEDPVRDTQGLPPAETTMTRLVVMLMVTMTPAQDPKQQKID